MTHTRYDIRVTSVWKPNSKTITFSGVPLIGGVRAGTKTYVIVKANVTLLPMMPVEGQQWRITGTKTEDMVSHNAIEQKRVNLSAIKLRVTMPESGELFIDFISAESAFPGVGDVYARKLWHRYQSHIYNILDAGDTESLEAILTASTAAAMVEGWKKYSNLKYLNWFSDHAIPPGVSRDIIKYHDESAIEQIKANPYILQAYGMAFTDVDDIAKEYFRIAETDSRRLVAAVEDALYHHGKKGHTVASRRDLKPILYRILDNAELVDIALSLSCDNADVIIDDESNYHPLGVFVMEQVVADRFLHLACHNDLWGPEHDAALSHGIIDLPFALTDKQADAVCQSLTHSIFKLTGGAGTGKTTVLRSILRAYQHLGYKVYPMALAGRAAKRIREGTGFAASTIAGFLKNADIKEDEKAIIVIDEGSMVDLQTMFQIVMALHDKVRILLVGDVAQLSPIGYGLVLHDVVKAAGIAGMELDIVKRQKGATGIPEYTFEIRQGRVPPIRTSNITFHYAAQDKLNDTITALYKHDPANSQVIGATYSAQHGGINAINSQCQKACNANGQRLEFNLNGDRMYLDIRVGDPIIFNKNAWDYDIQNGTMGRLLTSSNGQHLGQVKLDDGRTLELDAELIDIIRPAYAVSLHKAQGSQFPRVIIALTNSKMLDRSWIYTALTRAEKQIEIVGTPEQFEAAVGRIPAASKRNTSLHRLLRP